MRPLSSGLYTLAIIFISLLRPVQAQTTEIATKAAEAFSYGVTEEVTLTGTVSSVVTKATPGRIVGSHLLLATLYGPVDASLGRFGLVGNDAVSVAPGQPIEATGVMRTIKEKKVFLVRTIKAGDAVYTIRNEHGLPVSPQARERAKQKADQKAESQ
jgi:hypothetical protein